MRRALNVLQACHAAYEQITEDEVYLCTGQPHPNDIERVVRSMMGDEFTTAYQRNLAFSPLADLYSREVVTVMQTLKTEKGLALQDLITGAHEFIDSIDLTPAARVYLLDQIATTEYILLFPLTASDF
jgi:replication factor C subunit 3/5